MHNLLRPPELVAFHRVSARPAPGSTPPAARHRCSHDGVDWHISSRTACNRPFTSLVSCHLSLLDVCPCMSQTLQACHHPQGLCLNQDVPYLDSHHLRSHADLSVSVCPQLQEIEHF